MKFKKLAVAGVIFGAVFGAGASSALADSSNPCAPDGISQTYCGGGITSPTTLSGSLTHWGDPDTITGLAANDLTYAFWAQAGTALTMTLQDDEGPQCWEATMYGRCGEVWAQVDVQAPPGSETPTDLVSGNNYP
jgi:hypothetical protein